MHIRLKLCQHILVIKVCPLVVTVSISLSSLVIELTVSD